MRFCRDVFRPSAREKARDRRRTVDTLTEAELRRALARHMAARGGQPFDGELDDGSASSALSSAGPVTPPTAAAPAPPAKAKKARKSVVIVSEPDGRGSRFVYA